MRAYVAVVYLFLYAPIALIVLFSFNTGATLRTSRASRVDWYVKALTNRFVLEALWTSLIVALSSAVLATLIGTMAALALQRVRGWLRVDIRRPHLRRASWCRASSSASRPSIALVTIFDASNPALAALWPAAMGQPPQAGAGSGLDDRRAHPVHHGPGRSSSSALAWPAWTVPWSRPRWISMPIRGPPSAR